MEIRSDAITLQPLDPAVTVNTANGRSHASGSGQQAPQDVADLSLGHVFSGDDIRTGRVQALQSQIARGTYQVQAQDVASTLLSSMTEKL